MMAVGLIYYLAMLSYCSLKVKLKVNTGATLHTNCTSIVFTLFKLNSFSRITFRVWFEGLSACLI
jgi:hypothetical protein